MQLKDASILVVDDEPLLLNLVSEWFESVAARVLVAGDGTQALEVLQGNRIDLIISDVRMPVMDGITLLKQVKAKHGNCSHLILITGFADIEPREAYDLGAEAILEKPFGFDDLTNAAKRTLAERNEIWQTPLDLSAYPTLTATFSSLAEASRERRIKFGRGGFSIETKQPLAEGPINIKLDFKTDKFRLSGQGIIRWLVPEENEVGVEFTYVAKECRERVLQLTEHSSSFVPNGAHTLSMGG